MNNCCTWIKGKGYGGRNRGSRKQPARDTARCYQEVRFKGAMNTIFLLELLSKETGYLTKNWLEVSRGG